MKTKNKILLALALACSIAYASTDRVLDGKFITNTGVTITLPTTAQTICGITETCTLTNKTLTAPLLDLGNFTEAAAPGTPAAGKVVLYAKADGLLYSKDDVGTETAVSGGGGGGATTALDNLAAVAINSSLLLDANNVYSLGDGTNQASVVNTSQVTSNAALTIYSTLSTDFYNAANDIGLYSDDNVSPMSLNFWNAAGTFKAGIKAPALAANYVLTLPVDDGASGEVLSTNGTGTLSWIAAGGSGANQQLSNLSGTVAVNLDLIFDTGSAATVKTKNSAAATQQINVMSGDSSAAASGGVLISTGTADGTVGATGDINMGTGNNTDVGGSGSFSFTSGSTVDGTSGGVALSSGASSLGGSSGNIGLYSGATTNAISGVIELITGAASASDSGAINLSTGTGSTNNSTGNITLISGQAFGTGSSGTIIINSGSASTGSSGAVNISSSSSAGGGTGGLSLGTGPDSAAGATGSVSIDTGGSTTGDSGSVLFTIGAAGGTQGQFVFLKTGVASVVGQVWTATGTGGQGYWATPSAPAIVGTTGSPTLITAGGGVAFSGTNYSNTNFIAGNAGAVTVTANPQVAAATNVGQVLVLIGRHATNTVTLADGTGLSLNGSWVGGLQSVLTLQWDGTVWVETSRR